MYIKLTGDKFDDNDPTAYSRHHFYTLETGRENIQVRVSDRVSRTIKTLVNHPQLDHYQTQSDFVRDAIMHRLHDLETMTMDRELMNQLMEDFENEATMQRIHAWRRQEDLLRTAANDTIDLLKTKVERERHLTPSEETTFYDFLNKNRLRLSPENEAEIRLLLLFFTPSPAQIIEMEGRHPDDHEMEAWVYRSKVWNGDDLAVVDLSPRVARQLGLMS